MLTWCLTGNPGNEGHTPSNAANTGGHAVEPRPIKTEPDTPTLYSHHNIHTQVSTEDCIIRHVHAWGWGVLLITTFNLDLIHGRPKWGFITEALSRSPYCSTQLQKWALEQPDPHMNLLSFSQMLQFLSGLIANQWWQTGLNGAPPPKKNQKNNNNNNHIKHVKHNHDTVEDTVRTAELRNDRNQWSFTRVTCLIPKTNVQERILVKYSQTAGITPLIKCLQYL